MAGIDKLIINSAFHEPEYHWKYNRDTQSFKKKSGRRPAGYFIASQGSNAYNDIGEFIEIPLVNTIRPRVKAWRDGGYSGVTGVTKKLLEHWNDRSERTWEPFFWCQLDAIETLIWLTEAPVAERTGINIRERGDGSAFTRLCTKLCTGGGKTVVMAMLIAWHICNKVTYPQDKRFSKNVFIVAPGLTVKNRLQVLHTSGDNNYYADFKILPIGFENKLRQGKVVINNWQKLAWDSDEAIKKRRSVDKRGAKSDEAYVREVLREMANAKNILVINDEAHHAWRKNPEIKVKLTGEAKEAEREATIWVSGLDRIHNSRGIHTCYDFSATPFAPSGKKNDEEALFGWIVSDFGLNDGIESGLVKTPRVVVRDDALPDAKNYRSKLYHIYSDETVKGNINRPAKPEISLPDLVEQAYRLLGKDWQKTYQDWRSDARNAATPPVMITVANRTETAARIKYSFDRDGFGIEELCAPELTIHIDSKTMDRVEDVIADDLAIDTEIGNETESGEKKLSKKDAALIMRNKVDTVGQRGKPGEQIRNVISVGMLSEGWDAKTVTHIMGLRAFTSQLLCEQVVGRGLRRTSYDFDENTGMFEAEYVNIFGIPFSFLPHESDETVDPKPPKPKTQIEVLRDKTEYQISWPNIIRLDRVVKPKLSIDINRIETLFLEASETRLRADLAPIVDGKTDLTMCSEIDLEKLDAQLRQQTVIFNAAARTYGQTMKSPSEMIPLWQREATNIALFGQIVRLVEEYLALPGVITINPPLFNADTESQRRRIIYAMNMNKIVQHLWQFIESEQTEKKVPVLDATKKVRNTGDMPTWYTSKPCYITKRSHISHCVCDSTWEETESFKIERNPNVAAWAKNDHLGFEVAYIYEGVIKKYRPDFLIRLKNDKILVLETKGKMTEKDIAKRNALKEWIEAVNGLNEYGEWCCDVSLNVGDVDGIIGKWCS